MTFTSIEPRRRVIKKQVPQRAKDHMQHTKRAISLILFWMAAALQLYGQAAGSNPKPQPDVLILVDGEKLIGHLENAAGSTVTFKSDIVGEVKVDWSKIQEVHSSQEFAAIPKDAKL